MRILYSSSEVFPFSKTGGLADIASFLPKAVTKLGHKVTIITPLYAKTKIDFHKVKYLGTTTIHMNDISKDAIFLEYNVDDYNIIFVQNQEFFERDNFYSYDDDWLRFLFFSYATLEVVKFLDKSPDVIHVNDWQSALVPFLLDEHYRYKVDGYKYIHTLLTIHNLQYQGNFSKELYRYFNTDFNYTYIHFDDINYLKAGIERSSMINTVSNNYRNETLTQSFGFSLDGALYKRKSDYVGILNGIDQDVFDPKNDDLIAKKYGLHNYIVGKKANKEALLKSFGYDNYQTNQPIISYIGRLADQKGLSILSPIIEDLVLYSNAIIFLVGSGQKEYEDQFKWLQNKYPDRVFNYIGYNEKVAHQVYSASDLFVMPSYFEPCGLGQMIAMRYGALPVVREVGGLYDTVLPYNKYTKEGTGFTFSRFEQSDLKNKLYEAIDLYNNNVIDFKKLIRNAMQQNFSIEQMALEYIKVYEKLIGGL